MRQEVKTFHTALGEKGNVLFYALFVFPILISFAAIIVDVSAWYASGNELQQTADSLALRAAQFLPDVPAAELVIGSLQPFHANKFSDTEVRASAFFPTAGSQSIGVQVNARYLGTLSRLLPGLNDRGFPLEKQAVAEVVPMDSFFILSDGPSLRPLFFPSGSSPLLSETAWGEKEAWPQSGYFHCALPPRSVPSSNSSDSWDWISLWPEENFQRWMTQSCFNPALSALKLGVISVLDELQAGKENRVGLIFSPGDNPRDGFQIVKRLQRENPTGNEVFWSGATEDNRLLSDEVCMLLSTPSSAFTNQYELPSSQLPQTGRLDCEDPFDFSPCGREHIPTGHLSSCFLQSSLDLRRAVYWHAAKPSAQGTNLPAAIREALLQLRETVGERKLNEMRGNLAGLPRKTIYLVTDNLPGLDEGSVTLRTLLSEMKTARVEMEIVIYAHQYLSDSARALLLSRFGELKSLSQDELPVRLNLAHSSEELQTQILPQLLLHTRRIVLRN